MIIGISGKIGSGKDTIAKIIQYLVYSQNTHFKNDNKFILECLTDSNLNLLELERLTTWQVKKFADSLKDIVCILIGCTREQLEDQDFKNKELGEEWSKWEVRDWNKLRWEFSTKEEAFRFVDKSNSQHSYTITEIKTTPRKLLQLVGTECGRNILHENVWINATFSKYSKTFIDKGFVKKDGTSMELDYPNWLITDVRFPNEIQAIKNRGGLNFRVERFCYDSLEDYLVGYPDKEVSKRAVKLVSSAINYPELEEKLKEFPEAKNFIPLNKQHPSETSLDKYKEEFSAIIYNTRTIEDLIENVRQVLLEFKIIN